MKLAALSTPISVQKEIMLFYKLLVMWKPGGWVKMCSITAWIVASLIFSSDDMSLRYVDFFLIFYWYIIYIQLQENGTLTSKWPIELIADFPSKFPDFAKAGF